MMRQCAWCLRLINSMGERVSSLPMPKDHGATHGMCQVCGALWMEQVGQNEEISRLLQEASSRERDSREYSYGVPRYLV